jgi:hypothetical protein
MYIFCRRSFQSSGVNSFGGTILNAYVRTQKNLLPLATGTVGNMLVGLMGDRLGSRTTLGVTLLVGGLCKP